MRLISSILVATNALTLGLLLWKSTDVKPPHDVFAGAHSDVQPSSSVAVPAISTARMQRDQVGYAGTSRANTTVAAGRTTISDASGKKQYEVHMELVNNTYFGEYANTNGVVGIRRIHYRIIHNGTGESVVLVPMGFSTAARQRLTLVPNLYHFSYRAAPGTAPTSSFVSTVTGESVFADSNNEAVAIAWARFMPDFLDAYKAASAADASNRSASIAARSRRRLSFDSWMGGQVGGALGGCVGGGSTLAGDAGSIAGKIAGGEGAGDAVTSGVLSDAGSEIGGALGSSTVGGAIGSAAADYAEGDNVGQAIGTSAGWVAGAAVGKAAGGAIGGAVGGAVGSLVGPVGSVVGEEAGTWLGSKLGSYVGGDIGSTLGSEVGNDADVWASQQGW